MEIFITIIVLFFFLSILILSHELGHFMAARLFGIEVKEFGLGYPPRLYAKVIKGVTYSLNALPFGGFVRIKGAEGEKETPPPIEQKGDFRFVSSSKKAAVLIAGVLANFLIGWFAFSAVFFIGIPQAIYIQEVLANTPAAAVGFLPGDKILDFPNISQLVDFLELNAGRSIKLNIERQGEPLAMEVVPRLDPPKNEGALGVSLVEAGIPKSGFLESIVQGFKSSIGIIAMVVTALFSMFQAWDFAGVAGPVGIFSAVDMARNLGLPHLLQLLGFISLNLVLINLLPLPALDGGRLIFVLAEKIKGKPINYKLETVLHSLFFAILLFLMIIITIRDINRILP